MVPIAETTSTASETTVVPQPDASSLQIGRVTKACEPASEINSAEQPQVRELTIVDPKNVLSMEGTTLAVKSRQPQQASGPGNGSVGLVDNNLHPTAGHSQGSSVSRIFCYWQHRLTLGYFWQAFLSRPADSGLAASTGTRGIIAFFEPRQAFTGLCVQKPRYRPQCCQASPSLVG